MEKNNNKQVTLNITDIMPVYCGSPFFGGYEQPVYCFRCEVIVNGMVKDIFDTDLPLNVTLDRVVAEEYGYEEFEAEAKSAYDFDDEYIKDAMCDYIKNSEECELIDNYSEKIIKAFNEYMKGELVATKVTCKQIHICLSLYRDSDQIAMNKQIKIKQTSNVYEANNIKWTEGVNGTVTVNGRKLYGVYAVFTNYIDDKFEDIERTDPKGWRFYKEFFFSEYMTFEQFFNIYGR